jgi:hypothetical protein
MKVPNSTFLRCSIVFLWKSEESQIIVVGFVFTFFCRTNHATFALTLSSKFHVFGLIVKFCIIYRQYFMCLS